MSQMLKLENPMVSNAWGTKDVLSSLLGVANPNNEPQAEIWVGAHPKAPSNIVSETGIQGSLVEWISQAGAEQLGASVVSKFGQQLPFLFKILSAASPLSIQVHPNKAQAKAGFARENAAGIALDAAERNYKDANHKPEVICALTPFTAMVGFRPLSEMVALLNELQLPALEGWVAKLTSGDETTLREFYLWLMTQEKALQRELANAVTVRADELEGQAFAEVVGLAEHYPGDIGVISPLLLNTFELQPGEAVYLDAGTPHAYLRGTGIEVMSCSDNVLRGGLTPKFIDTDELLKTIVFETGHATVIRPQPNAGSCEVEYPVPVDDFKISLITLGGELDYTAASERNIELLYGLEGEVEVRCGEQTKVLTPADALLIPADAPAYTLSGNGRLARATA